MNDSIDICKVTGEILLDDQNILDKKIDVVPLSKSWNGFSKPNPFQNLFMTMCRMGLKFTGLQTIKKNLTK